MFFDPSPVFFRLIFEEITEMRLCFSFVLSIFAQILLKLKSASCQSCIHYNFVTANIGREILDVFGKFFLDIHGILTVNLHTLF